MLYNSSGDIMKELLNEDQIFRTLRRITHEIIERNNDLDNLIIVGIKSKGDYIAKVIHQNLEEFAKIKVPLFSLDITNYRDDILEKNTQVNNFIVKGKNVILVDDVLYTGRTARAAMDALIDLGRFERLEFAVLVDRGHRELPIRADYVGKNIPTNKNESIVLDVNKFNISIVEDK